MRRLWPVTKTLLLLAAGVVATDVPGWATAVVLAAWLAYWGWRDDVRWEFDGQYRRAFAVGNPARVPVGAVLTMNRGHPNETRWIVARRAEQAVVACRPGRWVR